MVVWAEEVQCRGTRKTEYSQKNEKEVEAEEEELEEGIEGLTVDFLD